MGKSKLGLGCFYGTPYLELSLAVCLWSSCWICPAWCITQGSWPRRSPRPPARSADYKGSESLKKGRVFKREKGDVEMGLIFKQWKYQNFIFIQSIFLFQFVSSLEMVLAARTPIRDPMSEPATTSSGWCLWSTSLEMAQARARLTNTACVASLRGLSEDEVSLFCRYRLKKAAQQRAIWEWPEGNDLMESVSLQSSSSSNVDWQSEGSNVTEAPWPPQVMRLQSGWHVSKKWGRGVDANVFSNRFTTQLMDWQDRYL